MRARTFAAMTLASLLVACGGTLTARGRVLQPAQVPVRSFPRILVTDDGEPESVEVATRLAQHLAEGQSSVERLGPAELARARSEGALERTTVVVRASVSTAIHSRTGLAPRERLECGPGGCPDWRRTEEVHLVRGGLHLRVMEGATGRVLQDLRLDEEETGLDPLAMRLRVLAQLRQRATELVDQRSTVVLVELYPIDQVEVREALDAAQAGRWGEARRGLEAFVRSNAFRALPSDQQAHVLYDLGQARRFDARERTASRFLRAERALRAAVRLLPRPQFARAIADLEEDRRSRAMVRVQREAMVHNFALAQVELPVVATGDEDADGAAQR